MTFNNGERIVGYRLLGFASTVVYVLYVFGAYFPKVFSKILSETQVNLLTGGLTVVFILIILWPMIMKIHYISFSGDAKHITLRWYKTGIMPGESKSIEIPADRFAGYEIVKKKSGFHQYLILYQNVQGQKAAYDPVCINSLAKEQKKKLIDTLNSYKSVA